ncbi:MAG: hypothetical protein A3E37_00120 [Candidatus Andersenbacteria bacterium RIFCSPHIGHO2_12_FULL_46_9]|nr:MAG: Ribulose-phosphate 3-epimerase [Parcubacteria group bacterium GW2011_GWA2_45_14]OGY34090.1 MAG: hypothetical protein A3B76_04340 [Candidatus Andersenbacteria bacterium RIFCSPHIGHO2_02_FULL_46_16]OGY35972.1 MAG: hypothetical protein A3E37_00120 [Candidatus Andersenbacteria bacterium RIFCSPHIGHO2_12_FULL_46_9]OGY36069.1 MAG: hypothetical protein A3I08_03470 [Candidatus Andersenbacteria bacterium RIFCSPLOWO2_02_FULL_46_11]OGY42837.1 MAG: hypothetical protein A3G57_00055 [Candidatus Anderse
MTDPKALEVVPAILRKTYEALLEDWHKVCRFADHVQIDITDGIFAGNGTFREIRRFKQLENSQKIELHLMVHQPAAYVDDVCDLNPARCILHLESFAGTGDLAGVFETLRNETQSELALAVNPRSPRERLNEYLGMIDYVMFLAVDPGYANQPFDQNIYQRIGAFREQYKEWPIAVDGHVNKETIVPLVKAGATILCTNTAIFSQGDPVENLTQLKLLAESAES